MAGAWRDYDLPDRELLHGDPPFYRVVAWSPSRPCLVLGYGNDAGRALDLEAAREDGLPVYRRPTGGEAVLLTPAMAAVSLRIPGQAPPRRLFAACAARIVAALAGLGLPGAQVRGASDVCLGDLKVSGSAIYRGRGRTLFHAVVNVAEDPRLLARYLRHPEREPAYRRGRPHADFVTSLAAAGCACPPGEVAEALGEAFRTPPDIGEAAG